MGCCGSPKQQESSDEDSPRSKLSEVTKKNAILNNDRYEEKVLFIGKVPLFKRLEKNQHPIVAALMTEKEFLPGATVIKQGDRGDEFFIIRKGEASVYVQGEPSTDAKHIRTLKDRDYFGEQSLLREEPRSATVTADSKLYVFSLHRDKFQSLGLHTKLKFPNRHAVLPGGADENFERTPTRKELFLSSLDTSKTADEKAFIVKAMKSNHNLRTIVSDGEARWEQIADVAWKLTVDAEKILVNVGDRHADKLYVVQKGEFDIMIYEDFDQDAAIAPAVASTSRPMKTVEKHGVGDCFGELALLYSAPSMATIKATQKCVVWVVERIHFKTILIKASEAQMNEFCQYIGSVDILACLLPDETREIAKTLSEMYFVTGEEVFAQGASGSSMYILCDGEVEILKDGVRVATLQCNAARKEAKYFGENALFEDEVRTASVKVVSDRIKVLALHRSDFECLLGSLREIVAASATPGRKSRVDKSGRTTCTAATLATRRSANRIKFADLSRVGLLGSGGFGWVELWEHTKTHETYALKIVGKGLVVKMEMQPNIINEKNIMLMTSSPFIIKLYETYADDEHLYFLMEPALGGELFHIYHKFKLTGSEHHSRYYVAGTALAFYHMHDRHIIYRDLKPENLITDKNGHMKVTDMGLAKFCMGKTYTACGTPDYFAPEVITCTGHGEAVDWWCLGIFIFELMHGTPPFESADPLDTYAKAMQGIEHVIMPATLSTAGVDLLKDLLKKVPNERLPMRPNGRNLLQMASWFQEINWDELQAGTFNPPHIPVVKTKKDLANFNQKFEKPEFFRYVNDQSGWDADFAT